jgi:hypothetical protein
MIMDSPAGKTQVSNRSLALQKQSGTERKRIADFTGLSGFS